MNTSPRMRALGTVVHGMSKPTVSVVITAYNRESTIAASIESCLSQTVAPIEIIVVDDASTDGTVRVAEAIADPRIRILRRPINGGQCVACNEGIDAARGDLVAFLDSDDIWLPHKLEAQIAVWSSARDRLRTVVYSPVMVSSGTGFSRTLPYRALGDGERVGDYLLFRGGLMQTSTLLCDRSFLARIRYDERTRRHTDYGLTLRLENAGAHFAMAPEALVVWGQRNDGSRVSSLRHAEQSARWLECHREFLSFRAECAFRALVLAPAIGSTAPMTALGYKIAALAVGAFSVPVFLEKLARTMRRYLDR